MKRLSTALWSGSGALNTPEIGISIKVGGTLRDTVEVVKIGTDTSGTIGGNEGASGTSGRAPVTSNPIGHQISSINATGNTGALKVKGQGSRALLDTQIIRKQKPTITAVTISSVGTIVTSVDTQFTSPSSFRREVVDRTGH